MSASAKREQDEETCASMYTYTVNGFAVSICDFGLCKLTWDFEGL